MQKKKKLKELIITKYIQAATQYKDSRYSRLFRKLNPHSQSLTTTSCYTKKVPDSKTIRKQWDHKSLSDHSLIVITTKMKYEFNITPRTSATERVKRLVALESASFCCKTSLKYLASAIRAN